MASILALLLLSFSLTYKDGVWAQTDERVSRRLGGGLTINTLPDNKTHTELDSSRYYSWRSFGPGESQRLWVEMSDLQHGGVRTHNTLSNTHNQAVRVALSFDFPFYGHYLRQVTIATGGFIFTGDLSHRMLTSTQYIAPLMADFDPSFSKDSTVQYLDNGEMFVVQWEKVRLMGKESDGAFTFQAALHKTGSIIFSYREIPVPLDGVSPVKAGLSDAFTATPSGGQQRTIYEYHRVKIDAAKISRNSAVEFSPLPTCLQLHSCESCLSSNQTSGCSWCNVLQRCSDGMDRHRQEWLDFGCSEESSAACEDFGPPDPSAPPLTEAVTPLTPPIKRCEPADENKHRTVKVGSGVQADSSTQRNGINAGINAWIIAGITAALLLLISLILLVFYMNYHPAAATAPLLQRRRNLWPSLRFQKQPGYSEVEGGGHEKDNIIEVGPC